MYTRRWKNNCCCPMNNHMENNPEDYETMCDDITDNCCNYNDYNDCCECGYEDNDCCGDIFPINPLFGQSYVPVQRMNQTFRPCARITKRNYIP